MIHVWEGMTQPCFVVPCSLNFKSVFPGDKDRGIGGGGGRGGGGAQLPSNMILIETHVYHDVFLIEFVLTTDVPSYLLLVFLPCSCVAAGLHHANLGELQRMWSLSDAYSSSQRGCSSPERGCILTATSDVTMLASTDNITHAHMLCPLGFFSLEAATSLRAALQQEGNYLSTPITSMPAILLTSAPDESPTIANCGRLPRSI